MAALSVVSPSIAWFGSNSAIRDSDPACRLSDRAASDEFLRRWRRTYSVRATQGPGKLKARGHRILRKREAFASFPRGQKPAKGASDAEQSKEGRARKDSFFELWEF